MRFRIIGNGAFGCALAKIFPNNLLEDSLSEHFLPFNSYDYAVLAVPSNVVVPLWHKIKKFGKPKCIIIVAKGLCKAQLLSVTFQNITDIPIVYLAGPNLAKEIMIERKYLSFTLAGNLNIVNEIKSAASNVLCDISECMVMPQVCAFMKNITAFIVGYLNLNENARATIIMQGIKEAKVLAHKLGSQEKDILRACVSDFILTCTSGHSRNYQAGVNFRNNYVSNNTQESLNSIEYIEKLKGDLCLPIVDFCYDLLVNKCVNESQFMDNMRNFKVDF